MNRPFKIKDPWRSGIFFSMINKDLSGFAVARHLSAAIDIHNFFRNPLDYRCFGDKLICVDYEGKVMFAPNGASDAVPAAQ